MSHNDAVAESKNIRNISANLALDRDFLIRVCFDESVCQHLLEQTNFLIQVTSHEQFTPELGTAFCGLMRFILTVYPTHSCKWGRERPDLVARIFRLCEEAQPDVDLYVIMAKLCEHMDELTATEATSWAKHAMMRNELPDTDVAAMRQVAVANIHLRWPCNVLLRSDTPRFAWLNLSRWLARVLERPGHGWYMKHLVPDLVRLEQLLYYADVLRIGLALRPAELSVLQLMAIIDAGNPTNLPFHTKWHAIQLVKHSAEEN